MMVRHFAGMKPANAAFLVTLSSDTNQANLRTLANSAGYSGSGNCTITLATTKSLYSTSTGTPGCVPGSWPAGAIVTLIISSGAFISGMGGNGGNGYPNGGVTGGDGGTALDASSVSGFTFKVDNQGTIRGGGGGGGGGAIGNGDWLGNCTIQYNGGGGGGGGQGAGTSSGGSGGPADFSGSPGGSGSSGGAGAGGSSGQGGVYDGYGGAGGGWGSAGSSGHTSYASGPWVGPVGGGGAAGKAVNGNSNITWITTGTRQGTIA